MKYKVLQHIKWGELSLEKGQIILIDENDSITSLVSINHYPEKSQIVHKKAVQSIVDLKKLEKY